MLPYFIPSSALTAGMDERTPPPGCPEGSFLRFSSPPAAARVTQGRPPEKALAQRAEAEPTEAGINLQTRDGRAGLTSDICLQTSLEGQKQLYGLLSAATSPKQAEPAFRDIIVFK